MNVGKLPLVRENRDFPPNSQDACNVTAFPGQGLSQLRKGYASFTHLLYVPRVLPSFSTVSLGFLQMFPGSFQAFQDVTRAFQRRSQDVHVMFKWCL